MKAAWMADLAWARSDDRERGGSWGSVHETQLRRLVEAAAPLLVAAGRKQLRDEILARAAGNQMVICDLSDLLGDES